MFGRVLDVVEKGGNRLPHPFWIFLSLALLVILLSWVLSALGVSVEDPGSGDEVVVTSLVSGAGLVHILTSAVTNFVEFPPLGLVLTIMLGIGLAQQVGLIRAFMQRIIASAPSTLVTYAIILAGIFGSLASNAAYIAIPPLAALAFLGLGRHPLAGIATGFAAVGAGFNANLLIGTVDPLLSGISTEAASSLQGSPRVSPVDNYFFIAASTPLLVVVGALVTEKIIEPRLGEYGGERGSQAQEPLTGAENRGLRNALIAAVLFVAGLALAVFPQGSPLRGEGGSLIPSPLLDGTVVILLLFFFTVAVVYGLTAGTITRPADIPYYMGEAMKDFAGLIVVFFAAAQFIDYFNYSNISTVVAVSGAELLQSVNLAGLPVIVAFIFVVAIMNLFITSGSAQWALLAPIFVPVFFYLGYDPAYAQLAFRIGDSSTNIITPVNLFVPAILGFMREYDPRAGFGTLFSLTLPFAVFFLLSWTAFFAIWSLIGLPIGPGVDLSAG